ncbi:hypothetical protein E2562_006317 [Oryza meyeriana var. granulata]|uniref:Uncharacterized protein n=1 Tax=Oryza meyeriana var. granulata TaxID=110450 RepID=A0A6G1EHH9_9ORYZ|nr:hypothetical protein E2562_006317 [Oryza meyeriana var. granulata]
MALDTGTGCKIGGVVISGVISKAPLDGADERFRDEEGYGWGSSNNDSSEEEEQEVSQDDEGLKSKASKFEDDKMLGEECGGSSGKELDSVQAMEGTLAKG